jgi:hypothetical protein
LLTVTSLFKLRATSREVKLKLVEFLYFYLMPETRFEPASTMSAPNTGFHQQRRPSKLLSRSVNGVGEAGLDELGGCTKTTEAKQALLGRYLNNVADLVEDLKETAPFGATVY